MLLGEARSKCEHLIGAPLRPEINEQLHNIYLAKGAVATTAIEGNTLTEEEALDLIQGKLTMPHSREYQVQELTNMVSAFRRVFEDVRAGRDERVSIERLTELNGIILRALPHPPEVPPGELRKHTVGVGKYRAPRAEDCPELLLRLCEWLEGPDFGPDEREAIEEGTIKAILAHLYLAWIHPFGDGNGRTARLIEFQILLSAGYPTPAAHLLSNHYNATRSEYYRQLEQASRSGGDVLLFLEYALRGFVDGLRSQIEVVRSQQWTLAWENYVHFAFSGESRTAVRRRYLVLDLSDQGQPVPRARLSRISGRVAAEYAGKGEKTLTRDLDELKKMRLIVQNEQGYFANRELILSFLPAGKRALKARGLFEE